MKHLSKLLAFVLALGIVSCAGEAAYVVESSPPAPRSEVVVYKPGHVWVNGSWSRQGSRWHWNDGHYVRERRGYVYTQPRWERRGRGYVYVQGEWHPRGRVYSRR